MCPHLFSGLLSGSKDNGKANHCLQSPGVQVGAAVILQPKSKAYLSQEEPRLVQVLSFQ